MIPPEMNKTNTFAIIQFSHERHIIQTLQAAMELKRSHPTIQLLLICREQFSRPIEFKLKEAFSKIIYLKSNKEITLYASIDSNDIKESLEDILDELNSFNIDVTINLNHSKTPSYLAHFIKSKHKLGFTYDRQNQIAINDRWGQFICSNLTNRPYNAFNLVDLFKKVLGTNYNSYIKGHKTLKYKKIIIHPFTLKRKRKWPLEQWSEVIYHILKNHSKVSIVVMGETKDIKESHGLLKNPILKKYNDRLISIVGEKNLEETYNEFRNASLFIGHDSIGGHLASLFHVQAVTIGLGTTQVYAQAPYGNSNYNITSRISCFPCYPKKECTLLPCHQDISHKVVTALVDDIFKNKDICFQGLKNRIPRFLLDKVDIYKSYIDSDCGMFLINCLHNEPTIIDIFKDFYHVLWGFVLSEQEITLPFPELSLKKFHLLQDYHAGLNHAIELNKFGRSYSRYIIEEMESQVPNITSIRKYANKLSEVEQFLLKLKTIYPHVAPLIDYYHIISAYGQGSKLKELSESSFITYHEAIGATEALQELIAATLNHSEYSKSNQPTPLNSP